MNRHQNIIDGVTNPNCRLCAADGLERNQEPKLYEESPEHIMWYCPEIQSLRVTENKRHPPIGEWNLDDLLWLLENQQVQRLLRPRPPENDENEEDAALETLMSLEESSDTDG